MNAAERKRLHRERKAAGLRVLHGALALDPEAIAWLVQSGRMRPEIAESDSAMLEWVAHYFDVLAEIEGNAVPHSIETASDLRHG